MRMIQANNLQQFLDIIEGLIHRGLTFKSDAETFTIFLTGGY